MGRQARYGRGEDTPAKALDGLVNGTAQLTMLELLGWDRTGEREEIKAFEVKTWSAFSTE